MRIDEAEGLILRQRDPLAGRRHRRRLRSSIAACGDREWRGARHDGVEIEMALGHRGEAIDQGFEIGVLAGLHEAEMALGQCERRLVRHGADDGNNERADRFGDDCAVPFAADTIQDDAGDAHGRIVRGKTSHDSRGRLHLARNIEHQHDRQAEMRGEIGGGAAPAGRTGRRGRSIEQAHDAFDHQDIGAIGGLRRQGVEKFSRHGPGIEIDARGTSDGGMERRIDVIGPRLRRAHDNAAPRKRRQQRKRHRRFAGAGMRRGDDEPARLFFCHSASITDRFAMTMTPDH